MDRGKSVIVIGAGPGGLASAMLLCAQGYQVTVLEKQAYVGGRTSALKFDGYTFDRGPTFLMMPQLLEELFHSAGRWLHDYIKLVELNPLYRLQFGGTKLELSTDREKTAAEIERVFPGESKGYLDFLREEGDKFERVMPLLQRPFMKLTDYLRRDTFHALPKLHLNEHVYGRLSRYFKDERLRYSFAFQSKYLGMSPWNCPGTFTILSYIEHAYGLWHPIGGVNRVCEAMAEVIREYGGNIRLETGAKQVLTKQRKAVGVLLENGDTLEADHVILNADFGMAITKLFQPEQLKKWKPERLHKLKWSISTYMLYLGINRKVNMPHHTVMFADDYSQNLKEMVQGKLSTDASVYVHNPSAIDPTLAPEGKSALYILVPVPNLDGETDWSLPETLEAMRTQVLARLEREPELQGLSDWIEVEKTISPLDWEQSMFVYKGAAFNMAHSLDQMMMLRPHNRFEDVANCYLVGGGTHPGSGLPTIFESARISVNLLLEQDGRSLPARQQATQEYRKEAASWR
ncbi:phytoene desaturase family protein [Paenibacillus sinopodophylli]|uniref:phytoene desaturase family protein n=1 Tax=Paenibacillus sinopodophylli TaxID=1837342 RepID=UPI00110CC884|nr:phytoene desaturase family protein [Paenibacillus sinopodophylli]